MTGIDYYFADGMFYSPDIEYKTIPESAISVTAENYAKAMNRQPGETFKVDDEGNVTIVPVTPQQPVNKDDEYLSKRDILSHQFQADVERLNMAYLSAIVVDGSAEEAKISKIRDELTARKQQYKDDVAALDYEYGGQND